MSVSAWSFARKTRVEDRACRALSSVFSTSVLRDLALKGWSQRLGELLNYTGLLQFVPPDATVGDIFDQIYAFLHLNYRAEYVYKNALVSKILLGRHSLNTAQVLSEFRAGPSKADLVILNGTSTAYEIKSDYDSFDRLPGQLDSYLSIFDKIYLVTSEKQVCRAQRELPSRVGIIELTMQHTLRCHRAAVSNANNIVPEVLFDSLRHEEYCSIIKSEFGYLPPVPNTRIHKACKELFVTLPAERCHKLAFKAISSNRRAKVNSLAVKELPFSLRGLVLAHRVNHTLVDRIIEACQNEYIT